MVDHSPGYTPPVAISRRNLLQRSAALGGAFVLPVLTACPTEEDGEEAGGTEGDETAGTEGGDDLPTWEYDGPPGPETLFEHGVASGDPRPDAVILWTRVSPEDTGAAMDVFVEVALDPEFTERVAAETFQAGPERDFTLKIDLDGLQPATTYYYRFYGMDRISPIGRTRTAPEGATSRIRLGVYSCTSLAHGWMHGLGELAERADLDAVLCLGDYIYEYGNDEYGSVRTYEPPHELVTLEDYRLRYSQYRREAPLAEAHRQHPFIAVWDDHEVADNAWKDGADNHNGGEGAYADRQAAAFQAYDEWIPIRSASPTQIYRTLRFGDLLDLMMLDTRHVGRDAPDADAVDDESRSLLGLSQEAWLEGELSGSTAAWRILGQQVVMGQWLLTPDASLNYDSWDGYRAARNRLYAHLRAEGIGNVVVLTGDVHSSWVFDLTETPQDAATYDPATGEGSVGVEFVAAGVTSEPPPLSAASLMTTNPQLRWGEAQSRGYMVLEVTPERTHADFFLLPDEVVESADGGSSDHAAAWAVDSGNPHGVEAQGPLAPLPDAPPLAP